MIPKVSACRIVDSRLRKRITMNADKIPDYPPAESDRETIEEVIADYIDQLNSGRTPERCCDQRNDPMRSVRIFEGGRI